MEFEYKVIPAPVKGKKADGMRKAEEKFAYAIQEVMNEQAKDGWEFIRSETLPNTERTGITKRTTTERSLLVFRRDVFEHEYANDAPPLTATSVDDAVDESVQDTENDAVQEEAAQH